MSLFICTYSSIYVFRLSIAQDLIILQSRPMIPEAVISILACARIGAVHSVVFGGFAADQLAVRINHARAKVVITASGGVEPNRVIPYKPLVDAAIKASLHKPDKVILYQRPNMERASMTPGRDLDWEEEMETAKPHDCVPVAATDPLYVIYTSGTTGDPKGIVRDCGGYSVALKWSMKNIYDMNPGETFWAASDIGWVVGHSYIVYGPLLNGNTTILYEGKPVTPDAGAYWRVIQEHKVKAFFTAPTAFRTIKREDPEGSFVKKYDLSSLQSLWLAGERADPDTVMWAERILPEPVPVIDHWWQTETGWPAAANCLGLGRYPTKYGSCTHAVPGWDIRVVDDEGTLVQNGKLGNIVIKLPLPPGSLATLYQDDNKYKKNYLERFTGYYQVRYFAKELTTNGF
jgi:propionyl-CoA synthetase